ncbi:MAG: RNA methyltransferase [Spirochaetales bacterium]|nr:RNA methyltransferase [Spirochaetales bacterium]MCF7939815.1 RNA methyltransferase [Spirochaetales bacterium]
MGYRANDFDPETRSALVQYLSSFVTPERLAKMHRSIRERSRYFTVVLEDLYQAHNGSAVVRSCDCFGIQDFTVIENRNSFRVNKDIALGTGSWVDIHRFRNAGDNTEAAVEALHNQGYRVVATSPQPYGVNLEDFDIRQGPAAIVFGNELYGLSDRMLSLADEYLRIPIYGFIDSLNISVSAAVILHHLTWKLRSSNIQYGLDNLDQETVLFTWLNRSIKRSSTIIDSFLADRRTTDSRRPAKNS